jgi:AmmeMemoRadiSam system protein B
MIHLALEMRAGEIVPEARRNSNACGPGALAATVAAADAMGAVNGVLLEYRTSHDLSEEPEFRMGVGYVGIVY